MIESSGLYQFRNKANEIIYIGKANNIHKRLKQHRHLPKNCYDEIERILYVAIENKIVRDIEEILLISLIKPKYNTQLNYSDDYLPIRPNELFAMCWKEIDKNEYNFRHKDIEKNRAIGRPRVAKPSNWDEVILRWKAGKITAVAAMKELNLTKATFYRMVKEF